MIKVFTGLKGFAATLFFIAGLVLLLSILIVGFSKAIELILPLLIIVSYLLIIVFVVALLPATFNKDLRPSLAVKSALMSHALGTTTWMVSFFFVINTFGVGGIILVFLFQYLAPLALIAAAVKGSWHIAMHLAIWISCIYGMRFYSQWLLSLGPQEQRSEQKRGDIIDVEATAKE